MGVSRFSFLVGDRVLLVAQGSAGAVEYPEIYLTQALLNAGGANHSPFTDLRVDGLLFAEYRFLGQFGVNASVEYTSNISNVELNLGNVNGSYAMQWQRIQAYAGVRWFM